MNTLTRLSVSFCLTSFSLAFVACKELPDTVEISETRELTTKDEAPRIGATSAEQFLPPSVQAQVAAQNAEDAAADAGATASTQGGWSYQLPAGWKEGPAKMMRVVNLTFGEGEHQGEVYLSIVGGGVKPNVDRWFRQFGQPIQDLANLEQAPFMDQQGYLVSTQGRYEPGMGRPGKDEQGLLGVLTEKGGRLYTVKMIAPKEAIAGQRAAFLAFIASLKQGE